MSDNDDIQLISDPYADWDIERTSLPALKNAIAELRGEGDDDTASQVEQWLADPLMMAQFVGSAFLHALQVGG